MVEPLLMEMGIGWTRDPGDRTKLTSATTKDYVAEIERLRAAAAYDKCTINFLASGDAQSSRDPYAKDVADWCQRSLDEARKSGSLETRPFVQNAEIIIRALRALALPGVAQAEKVPVARPVAFRVPRVVDDKISKTEFRLLNDEDEARRAACDIGADYDGLYLVADRRAAFFAQPDPRAQASPTAPLSSAVGGCACTSIDRSHCRETDCTFAVSSTSRCTCQDEHRRGRCTEPGCPYSISPADRGCGDPSCKDPKCTYGSVSSLAVTGPDRGGS